MILLRVSQATDDFLFIILLIAGVLLLAAIVDVIRYGYHKFMFKHHEPSEIDQDDLTNQSTPISIRNGLDNQ